MAGYLLLLIIVATAVVYVAARSRGLEGDRAARAAGSPGHLGAYAALWSAAPALGVLVIGAVFGGAIERAIFSAIAHEAPYNATRFALETGRGAQVGEAGVEALAGVRSALSWALAIAAVGALAFGASIGLVRARPGAPARNRVERAVRLVLLAASVVAILTTVGIVLSLFFESFRFFARVPPHEFLFGLNWSPQTALRAEQVGASGAFGTVPLFYGTIMITVIALLVAGPVGLFAAIYLAEYAGKRTREVVKPVLEILAGIPTVVYGFFALLTVGPAIRDLAAMAGYDAPTQSALAAGLVMGIMIIPFVSSLSDDVLNAVPQHMRDGAYALGATKSEAVKQVVLPAALPGVIGALLLAVSRAIGETMIVVMAAGRAANMPINPLESVTTVTVQIVALLTGDQEFDSAKTLSAFALGLALFAVTFVMNVAALQIVRRYREKYE